MDNQQNCDACQGSQNACSVVVSQCQDVSVPIKIGANASIKNYKSQCCGQPRVTIRSRAQPNGECVHEIVVTQTIQTIIPIEYSASINVGETIVNCQKICDCSK